jgi:thymidylate synthase (FAD)
MRDLTADPRGVRTSSSITAALVDFTASDAGVVRAARVSTAGLGAHSEDHGEGYMKGLIGYLMRNRHGSPFEHNSMTFLVRAPIFTVRHLMRHRTWSFNEESARYKELTDVFYLPDPERSLKQVGKPGHYTYVRGTDEDRALLREAAVTAYSAAYHEYRRMLDAGIARELARVVLPVATYSTVYATCNARSLMHLLSLRVHDEGALHVSHPQREIEMVAQQMETEFGRLMPITHAAFEEHGRLSP